MYYIYHSCSSNFSTKKLTICFNKLVFPINVVQIETVCQTPLYSQCHDNYFFAT